MTRRRTWSNGAAFAAFGMGIALAAGSGEARAQNPNSTTVQLPTYNFFTTQTSVSVPDMGGTYLGGINRSASGGRQFGGPFIPGNRAFGKDTSGGGMSVHVQIHDLEAMDAALLAQPTDDPAAVHPLGKPGLGAVGAGGGSGAAQAAGRGPQAPLVLGGTSRYASGGGASSSGAGPTAAPNSLAALRDEKAQGRSRQAEEVAAILADGDRALREGKRGAAKIYFKQALRKADPDQQRIIQDRLAALEAPASASR